MEGFAAIVYLISFIMGVILIIAQLRLFRISNRIDEMEKATWLLLALQQHQAGIGNRQLAAIQKQLKDTAAAEWREEAKKIGRRSIADPPSE